MLKSNPKTSWNSEERMPTVSATAYVDDAATVIGDVRIGSQVYIAPGASLRADEATPIIIGDECNIQDCAVFHGLKGSSIELGKRISIAHGAIIHGPLKIGDESFVGFNSVVHASDSWKEMLRWPRSDCYWGKADGWKVRAAWGSCGHPKQGRRPGTCPGSPVGIQRGSSGC